jgi:hypothetical protein
MLFLTKMVGQCVVPETTAQPRFMARKRKLSTAQGQLPKIKGASCSFMVGMAGSVKGIATAGIRSRPRAERRGRAACQRGLIRMKESDAIMKKIRPIRPIRPVKPIDRIQNMRTIRPIGKTKWVKAHWRYDYGRRQWEWVLGHWAK